MSFTLFTPQSENDRPQVRTITVAEGISCSFIHLSVLLTTVVCATLLRGNVLSAEDLVQFDAHHYRSIARSGYEGFLVAFFPLFPLIWKVTGLGVLGISMVNAVTYYASLIALARSFSVPRDTFLVWLVVPSAFFYLVPYTEAIFFLGSALLLIGVHKDKNWQSIAGILLCSLARPAFSVLIPAIIIVMIASHGVSRRAFERIGSLSAAAIVGIVIVSVIQHEETGAWFGFFTEQRGWGNYLRLPTLPLTSWGGAIPTRLDAVALLFGCVSGILLLRSLLKQKKDGSGSQTARDFSLAYLFGISMLVLLFRGGEVFSLNRFCFATPFILLVINSYLKNPIHVNRNGLWLAGVLMISFFLLFGSFVHIQTFLAYFFICIYLLVFVALPSSIRHRRIILWVWTLLTFCLQAFYFMHYLSGRWVA